MFGSIDRIPKSDYGGQQYSTYLEGGYTFNKRGFAFTPLTSLRYMHLHTNGYTEEDAGDVNLRVDVQNYDALQSGLGAQVAYSLSKKGYTFIPEFHVKWLYEFLGENQQSASTFTGGGASYATSGFSPVQSSWNIGMKFNLLAKNNITLSFGYDFETKTDFYSHSGRSLNQRREALQSFKSGKYKVLVATDIAARGIDVVGIELVINYDLLDDAQNYVHRIGRTGRAGHKGHAISFATPDQARDVRDIEKLIRTTLPIAKHPGLAMEQFIQSSHQSSGSRSKYNHFQKQRPNKFRRF